MRSVRQAACVGGIAGLMGTLGAPSPGRAQDAVDRRAARRRLHRALNAPRRVAPRRILWRMAAHETSEQLVVAISSRALFDFEEENAVFETADDRAYMRLQLERLEQAAKPGVAYLLIKKLEAFNADGVKRVDVVILSRHDPVSGLRAFRSVQGAGLGVERGVFTRGRAPFSYLEPLKANLFLSANGDDVRAALAA